jgi:glycosyltransferase involved in cell wall biosynthesis
MIEMESGELVSIVVPTYNRSGKLADCLKALCAQSYENIEIIIADDDSTDDTLEVAKEMMAADPRVKIVQNPVNMGVSAARNRAVTEACGNYVFFTDDDVLVPAGWVSAGLRAFRNSDCLGVEGQILYASDTYIPRYRDRVVRNTTGGHYMTASMAYRRDILLRVGLFNESLVQMEDRDLALRVLQHGTIDFSRDFTVTHTLDVRSVRSYFREAVSSARWIQFNMEANQKQYMLCFVYDPAKVLTLLFPPFILGARFSARFTGPYDYFLLLLLYPRLWYERFHVWKWAKRYKTFII